MTMSVNHSLSEQFLADGPVEQSDRELFIVMGKVVRERRRQMSMTQIELSILCGISRYYLSSIECVAKNMSVSVLRKITSALSLSCWEVLQAAEVGPQSEIKHDVAQPTGNAIFRAQHIFSL